MNKETLEETVSAFSASDSSAIQRIIGRTFIIEYGVITEVLGKGVVEVAPSVVDKDVNLQLFVCTLLSPCSKTFSIDIEPQKGDKVLVLFPRRFNNEMFDSDKTNPIISEFSNGYNALCGLAILMNQFRENDAVNNLSLKADGSISFIMQTEEDTIVDFSANSEGVSLTDINGNSITTSEKGMSLTDTNGCTIVTSSDSVKINDVLTIKKKSSQETTDE